LHRLWLARVVQRIRRGMRALLLALLLSPGAALASEGVVERTFSRAQAHAVGMTEALEQSQALPDEVKKGALGFIADAKALVSGHPIEEHYLSKVHGGKAVINTKDGRHVMIDSDASYIGLYGTTDGKDSEWGQMYLWAGQQPGKLRAVSWQKLVKGPGFREQRIQQIEAYLVPGMKRETWLVFSGDEALGRDAELRGFAKTETIGAMQLAGIEVKDTGATREIIATTGLPLAVKKLLQTNPRVRLLRARR
jgi:hypothetical protein